MSKNKNKCTCGCAEVKDKDLADAKHWVEDARLGTAKRQIFFTNGCFDGIHVGHLDLFKQIVGMCDFNRYPSIFVGVDSDERYFKVRGKYPRYTVKDRVAMITGMIYEAVFDLIGPDCFHENTIPEGVPLSTPFIMHKTPAVCLSVLRPTDYVKGQDTLERPSKQFVKDMKAAADIQCEVHFTKIKADAYGKIGSSRQTRSKVQKKCSAG